MKKLLLVAMMAFGLTANAQQRESGDIELIPYIGYSSSTFNGDQVQSLDRRNTARFGVNADYFFNDRWSLRSGLNYDKMGTQFGSQESNLDYINIPLNANWHFGSTRKWNLNFGVTPGFLISAEDAAGTSFKNQVESFQLGISYGIGYKLEISDNFSLMFDAQGLVGITDIAKSDLFDRMNVGSSFNIGGVFKL
ncbi:porin family protein [Tenacibaculum aiptasiae]|uniref:Porin family protein n=1 Tax=Tenacibaculum aiptasiae TaxID=426481 RepID=A0A7J5ANX8_9FLAO|nr:porin family protein [Tenacibaculum aiptasiae]KAB1159326.1 porin family protein [Tenacibaculum aiptasiae]